MRDKNIFDFILESYSINDEGESGYGMDSEFNASPLEVQREKPLEDGDITAMYFLESDEESEDKSLKGLEGPFTFRGGQELYYDPKEGKYYDRGSDMYLDNEEASRIVIGESEEGEEIEMTYDDYESIPEDPESGEQLLLDDMEEYMINDDPSLTEYDDEMGIFGGDDGWAGVDAFIFGEGDDDKEEKQKSRSEMSDSEAEEIVDDYLMDEESMPRPPGLDSMSTPPPAPTSSIENTSVKVGDVDPPQIPPSSIKVPDSSRIENMSSIYEQFDLSKEGPLDYRSMCDEIEPVEDDGRMLDYKGSEEGEMTKRDLMQLSDYTRDLAQMIRDSDDLPEWVQEKISIAKDKIDSAYHYLEYKIKDMEDEELEESPISPEAYQDISSYFVVDEE